MILGIQSQVEEVIFTASVENCGMKRLGSYKFTFMEEATEKYQNNIFFHCLTFPTRAPSHVKIGWY